MATVASMRMLAVGPVQFPVDVLSVVPSPQSLKNVCCGTPDNEHEPTGVRQPKVCQFCGEVEQSNLRKAAKVAGGYVLIDPEAQAAVSEKIDTKKIVLKVHQAEQFHRSTVPGSKAYWLRPSKDSDPKGYNLFRQLVGEMGDYSFVAVWAARSKPTMFELTMHDGVLMLSERVHVENANPAPAFIEVKVSEQDMKNMKMITTSMVSEFDKEDYAEGNLSELLKGQTPIALVGDKDSQRAAEYNADVSQMLADMAADVEKEKKKKDAARKRAAARKAARTAKSDTKKVANG